MLIGFNGRTAIDFLSRQTKPSAPSTPVAALACEQIYAYLRDPNFKFTVPVSIGGTLHQMTIWRLMQKIPRGKIITYGEAARVIKSAPRAVGQACGANPLPIIIPCHRIVAKNGLGGFKGGRDDNALAIKRWLLAHEAKT